MALVVAVLALLLTACAGAPRSVAPSAAPGSGSPATGTPDASASQGAAGPTPLPGCASLEAPPNEGRAHVAADERVTYLTEPPTSGPHDVTPAQPGWYDTSPSREQLVHSLEHGFIVIYRSGLDTASEAALRAIFEALVAEGFTGLISVPDEEIRDPLTMTAWDRLQRCVRAEPEALEAFVREHYAQAPEANVACALPGAEALDACQALLAASPAPTRAPTAADEALLGRIPEDLRAACQPTLAFASGADAGWDCFPEGGGFAYGYAGFPTAAERDAFFDGVAGALEAVAGADCEAGEAALETFERDDGTRGRLACTTTGVTRSFYWTVEGGTDMGIAVALDDTDLRAFFETAGPSVGP